EGSSQFEQGKAKIIFRAPLGALSNEWGMGGRVMPERRGTKLFLSLGLFFIVFSLILGSLRVVYAATVTTDKGDYTPGETVIMTGTGWMPGETVELLIQEDPVTHGNLIFYAQADFNGDFINKEYSPELHDIGVVYTLTATGLISGLTATATFADNTATDFRQCANQDPTLGDCHWLNSILQQQNSIYFEG